VAKRLTDKDRDLVADLQYALWRQLGTFTYVDGELRRAGAIGQVSLTRREWAEIRDFLDRIWRADIPRVKNAGQSELDSFLRVRAEIDKAARVGQNISEAEAIRRAGGRSTRRHYYKIKRQRTRTVGQFK
jgi:hypothetical protein